MLLKQLKLSVINIHQINTLQKYLESIKETLIMNKNLIKNMEIQRNILKHFGIVELKENLIKHPLR